MADRIALPRRTQNDERLLIAETLRELEDVLDILAINSNKLLPGAMASDFTDAVNQRNGLGPMDEIEDVIKELVQPLQSPSLRSEKISDEYLQMHGLTEVSGKIKRGILRRLLDEILNHLRPSAEKNIDLLLVAKRQIKAGCEAAASYFELAKTFFESVCPYGGQVGEFLAFAKQLCEWGGRLIEA